MNLLWELWFWCLLHGALPCVSVAVLPRGAKAFDGVFALLFAPCSRPCLAMAAAVGLCDCALAARVSSFAAAPSLCWWGRRRANALVELRPSGRGKAPTAADGDGLCCRRCDGRTSPVSQSTEMDEGRTASPTPLIIPPSTAVTRHTHLRAASRPPSGCL
ncbi:putative retrotransposon hot spot (RHS) protein [Trypanosoma cruzi]|nr:putative retrotransposon hot spot (RHS) protein [Trypanosoma cruzi]